MSGLDNLRGLFQPSCLYESVKILLVQKSLVRGVTHDMMRQGDFKKN